MTPKEKANELVQRYSKMDKGIYEEDWKLGEVWYNDFHKQCALICVDEILKSQHNVWENTIEYYNEVKQEINKL